MDRALGVAPAIRRAGSLALITALLGTAGLGLAGCTSSSSSPVAGSSPGTASASPGLSVPGTHKATARYQVTAPVSTVVIVSHVGNVTRVGAISASFTAAPTAVRASANVGAITVHVPGTTSYKVAADARVGKTTVSARQSASSGHAITATTDIGAIVVAPSP
jgi:hypothetical protein